ncbi:MAG: hypothetical protein OD918_01475 [Gammaproteobacteria bacterium]
MSDWTSALHRELEQWNFDGIAATLWWRDTVMQHAYARINHASVGEEKSKFSGARASVQFIERRLRERQMQLPVPVTPAAPAAPVPQ